MKWFQHDADATTDAKIKKLILRHSAEGYAVYFHCLELIAGDIGENNITFELEHDSEIIADNLKIRGNSTESGIEIVEKIMRTIVDLELFKSIGTSVFCFKLRKRLNSSMTSSPRLRALLKKENLPESIGKNKLKQTKVMTKSCSSHDRVMLDYTRLEEKKEKVKKENPDFDKVWAVYPRKESKVGARSNYEKLIKEGFEHEKLLECATRYARKVSKDRTEKNFIISPRNFFGEARRFEEYLEQQSSSEVGSMDGSGFVKKKCVNPECGYTWQSTANFCTVCGTDL